MDALAKFTTYDPTRYKVHRTVEGSSSRDKKLLPIRKGIADVTVRTQVCAARLNNFVEQVATLTKDSSLSDILSTLSTSITSKGRKFRGLDVMGKDRALLEAVATRSSARMLSQTKLFIRCLSIRLGLKVNPEKSCRRVLAVP